MYGPPGTYKRPVTEFYNQYIADEVGGKRILFFVLSITMRANRGVTGPSSARLLHEAIHHPSL